MQVSGSRIHFFGMNCLMTSPLKSHKRVKYMRTKIFFLSKGTLGKKEKTVDCKKAFELFADLSSFFSGPVLLEVI